MSAQKVIREIASINKLYSDNYTAYLDGKQRLAYLKGKLSNYKIPTTTDSSELKKKIAHVWRSESARDYDFTSRGRGLRIIDDEAVSSYGQWSVVGNQLKRSRWDEGDWTETIVFIDSQHFVLLSDRGVITFYSRAD